MIKLSIPYLCLTFLVFTVQLAQSSSLTTLSNAFASQNGEVIIRKDEGGLYVEADLSFKPLSNINVTKMMIGLGNSETLLSTGCLGFDRYSCDAHDCVEHGNDVTVDYPHFTAQSKYATTDTILDYTNWELKNYAHLGYMCKTQYRANFGRGRGGIVGLGRSGNSKKNNIGSKIFSIYLNEDLKGGKLLWKYDSSLVEAEKITLAADENWKISLKNVGMSIGLTTIGLSDASIMFDIHADAIGLPLDVFNMFIEKFNAGIGGSATCPNDKHRPTCEYYGYIADLPKITLNFAQSIVEIPPEIYLEDGKTPYQAKITLNLKALGPDLNFENYVTDAFKNTVIMDAKFMRYYYTVFDASGDNNSIRLYIQGSGSSNLWLIIIGVAALIVIIAVVVYFVQKKKKSSASLVVPDYAADLPNPSSQNYHPMVQQP